MSLLNKNALVTGGVLGSATALRLAHQGASIAFVAHHKVEEAQEVVRRLPGPGKHVLLQADLRTEDAVRQLFSDAKSQLGGSLHIAINNVGKVLKRPIADIGEADYDEMFAVNAKAAFFFIKHASLAIEDGGKIVTVLTSLLGAFTGLYSVYAGSKAPVEHFTRAAAKELMARRISVNCIAPGPMDTPFFYPQEEENAVAFHKSQAFNGRLTDVEDIAPIIQHLVTEGQWITGQTIFANGGYTTR
ncbi:unnamed protein product [Sympodiomycopsis kandeliae]